VAAVARPVGQEPGRRVVLLLDDRQLHLSPSPGTRRA
jgi:hypothetical protein